MQPGSITKKELLSQPQVWDAVLARAKRGDFPNLNLKDFEEVIVFGSGTSYYLAMVFAELLEEQGVRARALPSCDVFLCQERYLKAYKGKKVLAIGISRSGESSEALIATDIFQGMGIPVFMIGCYEASSLSQKADIRLILPEAQETGLVMLRSFTSMVLAFQWLLGHSPEALSKLPNLGQQLLASNYAKLESLVKNNSLARFVFLGSGIMFPMAREAALKMQEMAITTSEAYQTLEYRHGPKSTAATDTLITLFAPEGDSYYGPALLKDLKAYGVTTLVITEQAEPYQGVADLVIVLESGLSESERLIAALLPVHMLAFETSLRLEQNPDVSRNLSQVVRF